MTSIKDIASELGVSTTTVSLVLTGKCKNGRVSKATIERVLECAQRLDYHPNMIAKSLKSGSSKSIGLVVTDITNPYFARLVAVIQDRMLVSGYTTLIMNTNESVEQMGSTITLLQDRQVDGFIIVPTLGGESYIESLIDQRYPLVLMDRYYPSVVSCNVLSDNYSAMYECVENLLSKGSCRRVAFVSIDSEMIQIRERLRGYREAMQSVGLLREEDIYTVDYSDPKPQMQSVIDQILSYEEVCDAVIFAINRLSNIGARELVSRGVEISEDMQIVYFDKSQIFDLYKRDIPHIEQPADKIATLTSELLLSQLRGESVETQIHKLPCVLHDF